METFIVWIYNRDIQRLKKLTKKRSVSASLFYTCANVCNALLTMIGEWCSCKNTSDIPGAFISSPYSDNILQILLKEDLLFALLVITKIY